MANWRGAWDSGTAYAAGDSAAYGGSQWYCVTASTGQAPGTGADWAPQNTFTGDVGAPSGGSAAYSPLEI
jgi:hypothetical protein